MPNSSIESKPSLTAIMVLKAIIAAKRQSSTTHLVPVEAARLSEHFLEHIESGQHSLAAFFLKYGVSSLPYCLQQSLLDLTVSPGYTVHKAMRKLFIEQRVRAFLTKHNEGQVLVLGAGYDTLSLRLSTVQRKVQFFEVDFPMSSCNKAMVVFRQSSYQSYIITMRTPSVARTMTHQGRFSELCFETDATIYKTTLIPKTDTEHAPNLHFIGMDLTTNCTDSLAKISGFDLSKPTIIVAEGFSMYLPKAALSRLLTDLRSLPSESNELVTSFIEPHTPGYLSSFFQGPASEDYCSNFQPDDAIKFMNRANFEVTCKATNEYLLERAGESEDANRLRKDSSLGREHYLVLKPSTTQPTQTFKGIKDADIDVPKSAFDIIDECPFVNTP